MNSTTEFNIHLRTYGAVLIVLLGLFCFRVIAQFIQSKFSIEFLPAFEAWHSGALPYHYLVVSQVLIVIFYTFICVQFALRKVAPKKWVGILFFSIGTIYAGAMAIRLFFGLFINSSAWFQAYIPIFFHFVLASFLLVVGIFHLKHFTFYDAKLSK